MNGVTPTKAGLALNRAIFVESELWIPAIVVHELWFGVAKSSRKQQNADRLKEFLTEPFRVVDFTPEDARIAGEIRAELARRGTPIGPYDVLIAGQALARDLTVVTANTREFSRVDGLKLVDWTK
jgi:tRNA(fMet)-specific endonuclease VapC